tara:strand:- start:33014 stop:33775 length:762 start_codon:yes stop_codon:yes gene_type:complete
VVTLTEQTSRAAIKIAVVEHLRQWWGNDSLWLCSIGGAATKPPTFVNSAPLRQMAQAYNVGRGIRKNKESMVAELLESKLQGWPDGLIERAKIVKQTAQEACSKDYTRGVLLSGFTKMFWFLKPAGWTMYDRFTQKALCAKVRNIDHYDSYYLRLQELDFDGTMEACRKVINGSPYDYLWPERILDKYLMLCGQQIETKSLDSGWQSDHDFLLDLWSGFHDKDVDNKVDALVEAIFVEVKDRPLFQLHRTTVD